MPSDASFFQNAWDTTKGVGGSVRGGYQRLEKSAMGRMLKMGAAESFGFTYSTMAGSKGMSQGFMGIRGSMFSRKIGLAAQAKAGNLGAKKMMVGTGLGGAAMGLLNIAFTAEMIYSGYQEEGVWGAAKGGAESVMWSVGLRAVGGLLTNPATLAAAAIGAVGYGAYKFGEAGIKHERNLRELEFGGGEKMRNLVTSAGAVTHRQRAVTALNNTHLNGRMSMGNEAMLSHVPWR